MCRQTYTEWGLRERAGDAGEADHVQRGGRRGGVAAGSRHQLAVDPQRSAAGGGVTGCVVPTWERVVSSHALRMRTNLAVPLAHAVLVLVGLYTHAVS